MSSWHAVAWLARSRASPVMSAHSLRYSVADLLRLRSKPCLCLSRTVKRRLRYFHLFVSHIPVRITAAKQRCARSLPVSASDRTLVRCATVKVQRRPKQDKPRQLPSLLLSNVRSLNNKLDEVERRTVSLKPEILVLTETWLDESIPNSCISLSGYSICRND